MTQGKDLKFGWLRQVLLVLSIMGLFLFTALFASTYAKQDQLERAAQGFIKHQIKAELTQNFPGIVDADIPEKLSNVQEKYAKQADRLKTMMDAKVDMLIADSISKLCGSNCEKKETRRENFRELFEKKFERASQASNAVKKLIQGKYSETLAALRRDIRIFSGTNIIAFAAVFFALLLKQRARVHLILPSVLLILSALMSIYLYGFQQNWFFTLIHGSYWGYAYTAYMAIIFGFLADVVLNKGGVITGLLNGLGGFNISLC